MMKLNKEEIQLLKEKGYAFSILANNGELYGVDENKYKIFLDEIKQRDLFHYHFYCNLTVKNIAEQELINYDRTTREYIKSFKKRFRAAKIQIIKDLYGIKK